MLHTRMHAALHGSAHLQKKLMAHLAQAQTRYVWQPQRQSWKPLPPQAAGKQKQVIAAQRRTEDDACLPGGCNAQAAVARKHDDCLLLEMEVVGAERVAKTTDVVKEGQKVWVKLMGFDERGKVRLSMKVVDQTTGEEIKKGADEEA